MSSGMDAAAAGRWIRRRPCCWPRATRPRPPPSPPSPRGSPPPRAAAGVSSCSPQPPRRPSQLSIGWSNDCIDSARDTAAGRADKPLARGALTAGALTPRAVGTAAAAALAAAVPLSLACGTRAGAAHLTGVAAGWAYNLRLKRTAASWLPYAVAFGALLPSPRQTSRPGG
ncbi:hypothetical protein ACFQ1I_11740 [Kitasatospora arboriphila]